MDDRKNGEQLSAQRDSTARVPLGFAHGSRAHAHDRLGRGTRDRYRRLIDRRRRRQERTVVMPACRRSGTTPDPWQGAAPRRDPRNGTEPGLCLERGLSGAAEGSCDHRGAGASTSGRTTALSVSRPPLGIGKTDRRGARRASGSQCIGRSLRRHRARRAARPSGKPCRCRPTRRPT